MTGNYLLDSNIIIDVFRGDPFVIDRVKNILIINIPVPVLGELYYGAYKSSKTAKRL